MTVQHAAPAPSPAQTRMGFVRSPQNVVAGVALVALSVAAYLLLSDLNAGTLRNIGPALLPRALAVATGLCGAALVVAGLSRPGAAMERFTLRGPLVVMLAVCAFALTIRPVELGSVTTPGLGLVAAGPLAIFISGFATPEARFRELLILALSLTAFCMVLFGDALNLSIPVFPQAWAGVTPEGWSQRATLRAAALAMAGLAALVWLAGRAFGGRAASKREQPSG